MRLEAIRPEFVEFVPNTLEEGVLYVSLEYSVAVHLCACGCKEKTVTPIGGTGWQFSLVDGTVTLHPSIGNYQIPCKAHYYIQHDRVLWL